MLSTNFKIYQLSKLDGLANINKLKLVEILKEDSDFTFNLQNIIKFSTLSSLRISTICKSYEKLVNEVEINYNNYRQCNFITYLDSEYPDQLKNIYDKPAILFYEGNISLLKKKSISIVGSRVATSYGIKVRQLLSREICQAGITVVSGLARGVDSVCHKSVIESGGNTIGVLGTGINVVYPSENSGLQKHIAENHLIISEYPPNTPAYKWNFPARNRIIAGLSQAVLVVEAKERSGTLITAQLALDMGRDVYAIPGNILSNNSKGCHDLINDGAKCVTSTHDILEEFDKQF